MKINNHLTKADLNVRSGIEQFRESPMEFYRRIGFFLLALVLGIAFTFPFYWLLKVALTWPSGSLYGGQPSLLIENPSLYNFVRVWYAIPFVTYLITSLIVTAIAIASQLLFCSLAAFGLTKDFYGKKYVWAYILSAMMIPFQTIFLPDYLVTQKLGLVNTYIGIAIVVSVSIVNILVLHDSFSSIPDSLAEAARLDGASELYILFGVYWPLSKPALATTTIFAFIFSWNSFLWPLVVVRDTQHTPLPLGLAEFQSQMSGDVALQYAFAIMVFIPLLIVFLLLQRQFIKSAVLGSMKS
ncbi:carbohydrate ABC transporter permease [Halopelagius fulvigenes]|uniref:Carbohydrate ABC transporter permease n=1 Tax=Halopelagius fulvigenes TaxID=1198324 RepID=A0ABD5U158_9EURY